MLHTKGKMVMEYDDSLGLGGQCLMDMAPDTADRAEIKVNHKRIMELWNAAENMSTEEAAVVLNDYQKRWKK